jgi:RNA polymerase sigma factor (sigma-70 family)
VAGERKATTRRRAYAPKVEALEALRLLDAAAAGLLPLAVEHVGLPQAPDASPLGGSLGQRPESVGHDAWDAALGEATLADWIARGAATDSPELAPVPDADAVASGLRQMGKYLARAWAKAGIAEQQHDDCTQAVHAVLLQRLGRAQYDRMLAEVGAQGIPRVLNRDTALGPDFFRAVDMIKKQAQRQKRLQALDDQTELAAPNLGDADAEDRRDALHEAIRGTLSAREAELVRATMAGFSPAEIAQRWGLAPKTVSNEKTRVLAKLRRALESA